MRRTDKVVAIGVADLHLRLRPPKVRRKEDDWMEAMARPLKELQALADKYDVPIVCAGDVFDYWKAEPELINFAIANLPDMYAVPGQHDLPLHNMNLIHKSAFWTLCKVDAIHPLFPNKPVKVGKDVVLHGFPWGTKIGPLQPGRRSRIDIAVIHKYIWQEGYSYPGAPDDLEITSYSNSLIGYHSALFGDNHKGFLGKVNSIPVINCGSMMRIKADQEEYRPSAALICDSGRVLLHRFNQNLDSFEPAEQESLLSREEVVKLGLVKDFIHQLEDLQTHGQDFIEAVLLITQSGRVSQEVKQMIAEALEHGQSR